MMLQQLPYRVGSKVRVYHVHGGYRLPEAARVIVAAKRKPGKVGSSENPLQQVPSIAH
jgi:hypothetical protein